MAQHYLRTILGGFLKFCREGTASITHATTGTVSVTSGDATVTGVGTAFTTEVAAADSILIGATAYTVLSVTSDTSLELTANAGASQAAVTLSVIEAASEDLRPTTATANWTTLAAVEDFSIATKVDAEEVMAPQLTGGYARAAKITKLVTTDLTFTVNEVTELIMELVLAASGAITTTFIPMSGDGMVRGWFYLSAVGIDGTERVALIVWAELSADSLKCGNSVPKPQLTVSVLKNGANYGDLTGLAAA